MSLKEITRKIVKDFDKELPSQESIKKILDNLEEGQHFVRSLIRDKNNFERLKTSGIFDTHVDNDKRGWLSSHEFPITLEILNKEKVPGGAVTIPSMGGEKADLLVYHALCPELENFVSLIVWLNSQSSKNAWNQILDLINLQDEKKVLQFSKKCGISLPNRIHPSNDRDSQLVEKTLYESLYDWRLAHYLFDDGKTIMSHNSPINFRRVVLDERKRDESFVGIRTTIGRILSIHKNTMDVIIPSLYETPRKFEWKISDKVDKNSLKTNSLYFFQIYKIIGDENIETYVRQTSEASPVDIIGMFLAHSLYLLYLEKSRLKLVNPTQFEKLFNTYFDQVSKFCSRNEEEISTMNKIEWKTMQYGYTNSFTKWIESELYIVPPLLRRYISDYDLECKEILIQKFDDALLNEKNNCIDEVIFNTAGNRIMSRSEIGKINKFYDFIHFLLKAKRFILKIGQNPIRPHQRDEEISWLKKQFGINN